MLSILNVGDGDTKISFDPANSAERERAAKIVTEMPANGYGILVQVGEKDGEPLYQRVKRFDPESCEYIVAFDPPEGKNEQEAQPDRAATPRTKRQPAQKAGRGRTVGRRERALPAASTRAVAVPRSAGG